MTKNIVSACVLLLVLSHGVARAYIGLDPAYTGVEYDSYMKAPTDIFDLVGLDPYAGLGLAATYDDNIYRTEVDEDDAMIYRVSPSVGVRGAVSKIGYKIGYKGNYGYYRGGPNDDLDSYKNHNADLGVFYNGSGSSWAIHTDYTRGFTPKGEDNNDVKDQWSQGTIIARYDVTPTAARISLRLTGTAKKREYDINQANDLNNTGLGAVLGWRVAPKTRLVLDGGYMRFDYPNNNRDADRNYLRAGVSWDATAKTTGYFSYGKEKYRPDNPGQSVESGKEGTARGVVSGSDSDTWKGVLTWLPRRRDSITLDSSRSTTESFGVGSNRIATRTAVNWGHVWSDRVSSSISYRFGNDDYIGSPRNDDIASVYMGLGYVFRDKHIFRGSWVYEQRDSNIPLQSYDQNRFTLTYGFTYN